MRVIAMLVALALTASCGDDTKPKADARSDGKRPDGKVADAGPSPEGILLPDGKKPDQGKPTGDCDPAAIGKFCSDTTPCAKGWCLTLDSTKKVGVCTCDCTGDDTATPLVNEDTCPHPGFDCSPDELELSSGKKTRVCMKRCAPKTGSSDCDGKLSCDPLSAAYYFGYDVLDTGYCAEVGCSADADCPVLGATKCDPAASPSTCTAPETCIKVSSTAGYCGKPGKCDTASGLCTAHTAGKATAKVGDTCKSDYDCAGNMTCMPEDDNTALKKEGSACSAASECCSGKCVTGKCTKGLCTVNTRGGYCTIWGCTAGSTWADKKCPTGSTCNLWYVGGFCQLSCDLTKAETCRGNAGDLYGDYECRAWNNVVFAVGGKQVKVAETPVCDFGTSSRCSTFAGASIDCTTLGFDSDPSNTTIENPTKMGCRGLDGTELTDKASPIGYCYDDTGSGTNKRNPMPTP